VDKDGIKGWDKVIRKERKGITDKAMF